MRGTMGTIVTVTLISLVVPLAAQAQPARKVPRVGVLWAGSPPSSPDWKQHSRLLQELHHLGWREGENLGVEFRWAAGRYRYGADLTAELMRLPVDVIVADSEPLIVAAQRAPTTIPIVMISFDDPVEMGFIASLARPGGNITGIDSSFVPSLSMKLLELLKEAVPTVSRVAVLAHQDALATGRILEGLKVAARALGVQPRVLAVVYPHGTGRAALGAPGQSPTDRGRPPGAVAPGGQPPTRECGRLGGAHRRASPARGALGAPD